MRFNEMPWRVICGWVVGITVAIGLAWIGMAWSAMVQDLMGSRLPDDWEGSDLGGWSAIAVGWAMGLLAGGSVVEKQAPDGLVYGLIVGFLGISAASTVQALVLAISNDLLAIAAGVMACILLLPIFGYFGFRWLERCPTVTALLRRG